MGSQSRRPTHIPLLTVRYNALRLSWEAWLHVVEKRSPLPRTSMDLLTALQDSWCEFPPGYLQPLVESMPHRFASLLRDHGGPTRY
ncbi:hypothetical protein AVEN_169882-1 [Araneus ventricosus]|uniref:Uncharacterized protein n=1 Tax=Araneus ventricosus TaxID=182803 RepID=A0A4Y2IKK7_ARAVE|nr:hypothetical protein AVEN_169882-1 [Araneus ventricosus]